MPDPLTRAEALIRANPRERAAYQLGAYAALEANGFSRPVGKAAAAYLLLADVAIDDATLLARARAAGNTAQAIAALDHALSKEMNLQVRADIEARRATALAELRRVWGER